MNKIRDWLYIGNHLDLHDVIEKGHDEIDCILNLVENKTTNLESYLFIDIDDGVPINNINLFNGIEFILNQYQQNKKILIACGAGVSRSATFCVLALKEIEKLSLIDALKVVKEKRKKALPHPALWKSVCEAYDEAFNYNEVLKI